MARWTLRRSAVGLLAAAALGLSACGGGTPSPAPTLPSGSALPGSTSSAPSSGPGGSSSGTTSPVPSTARTSRPGPTAATPAPTTSALRPTSASCSIPASLRGVDLEALPTTRKVVALTFDAGGSADGVSSILATLSREGVPATFFLTGDFVDQFPASAKAIARYPIGNHTYEHPDLTTLTDAGVRTQIRSTAARIRAVTGRDPRPLFRFPFGAVDRHAIGLVNAECYVPFRWTVDTLGWEGVTGGQSVDSVVSRVLSRARPGEIVLMHVGAHPEDHSTLDADALPRVISGLRAKGYGFVTLQSVFSSTP